MEINSDINFTPEYLKTITDEQLSKMLFSAKMVSPNAQLVLDIMAEQERRATDDEM